MSTEPASSFVPPSLSTSIRLFTKVLVLAIVLNPLIFIWQGGDLSDAGYHAMHAQNFFADIHGDMIPSDAVLTYFIGGLWWRIFPGLGLFGFHLLGALIVVAGSFAPFYALRELREHPVVTMLAILAGQSFLIRINVTFNYDLVSFFFQYWAVAFMLRGMERRKQSLLFLAGCFIAGASLARIPSILSLGFIVLPLMWKDSALPSPRSTGTDKKTSSRNEAVKRMALFLAGFASACSLAAGIGLSSGILNNYLHGLVELFTSSQQGGSHNEGVLFQKYFDDGVLTVKWLGAALLWGVIAWVAFDRRVPRWAGFVFIAATAIVLFNWLVGPPGPGYNHPLKYLVLAIYGTWSLLLVTGLLKAPNSFRTMATAGLMLACIGFLGSNTGLVKSMNAMLFLVPICTVSALYGARDHYAGSTRKWKRISFVLAGLLFLFSFAARFGYIYQASWGFFDRLSFTNAYKTPLMYGMYSSKERVSFVDDVVPRIEEAGRQRDLFILGKTPALYFLTERRPFIKELWLGNDKYSADVIGRSLESKVSHGAMLPLVVITERSTLGSKGMIMINNFLKDNRYIRTYERKDAGIFPCEIWTPE